MKLFGVILNLLLIAYLGYTAGTCLRPDKIENLSLVQDPFVISFLAVVALFFSLKD